MVSVGPNSQSFDFTHMYNFVDLRGCKNERTYAKDSILHTIDTHPDFTMFKYLVKLSKTEDLLSSDNFTLFIPPDSYMKNMHNMFVNMDTSTARHVVKSSVMRNKIPSELLESSPASFFNTLEPYNKLFVTNITGKTYINNDIEVIQKDILKSNGIIHAINSLILPVII